MRFLFVDRIVELVPGHVTRGIKHITLDDYYLCRDRQNKLCFTPALIGEALGQLAAWNVMLSNDFTQRPVAGVISSASLHRPAYVGETLLLESHIDSLDEVAVRYHGVARVADEVIFSIESALGPLLPMTSFIELDEVRRQFREIDRPGPWPYLDAEIVDAELIGSEDSISLVPMQFDRILSSQPGTALCAEKRISRAASYFPDHFPNKPVLPMTVLLQCKLNLVAEFLARAEFAEDFQVSEMHKIKMNEFVYPGDVVICYLKLKSKDESEMVVNFRSEVNGKRVCVLDVVLTSKGVL